MQVTQKLLQKPSSCTIRSTKKRSNDYSSIILFVSIIVVEILDHVFSKLFPNN